jgi:signal transduction histidine kinase
MTGLRVLLVEDSPADAKLVIRALQRTWHPVEFLRVETAEIMSAALEQGEWDIVISDWSMPQFDAPAALAIVKRKRLDLPFIIVSGTVGEEAAVMAMRGMIKMLERLLGADVELVPLFAPSLGTVRADPSSVGQVIMNLVVNARDAMPTGGRLTVEIANVVLDEAYAAEHLGAKPGPHVMLAITDTGVGMEQATVARVFEPFFSTKDIGKGTGLGLSTVLGIVQQSGGSVWGHSEQGKGTAFKVFLPRVDSAVEVVRSIERPATLRGSETILLAEDDDQLREIAAWRSASPGLRAAITF